MLRCLLLIVVVVVTNPVRAEVTFERDIMAVLAKAGCNMGTCHGNLNGKGGFKLSLRGADAKADYASLTRGQAARRINATDATASLLLLKPTMQVPHEGGRRFEVGSPEYRLLHDWIAAGAPASSQVPRVKQLHVEPSDIVLPDPSDEVRLKVTVTYHDGSQADVSRLAVYEPAEPVFDVSVDGVVARRDFAESVVVVRYLDQQVPVRVAFIPRRADFQWHAPSPVNQVDEHIFKRLKELTINPSGLCDDLTFLRRSTLDLTGRLPTPTAASNFLASRDSNKRLRLIDELLDSGAYADCWAQKWADLLRIEEKTLDRKGVEAFHAWVRNAVATNRPFDVFVREIVGGRGSSYDTPAANYYRAMRQTDMRAESSAQLFLGVRLQCAKCHNHPFDQWTQDDYYGWGNLFSRVDYEVLANDRRDKNDKHEFDGEQIVWQKLEGDFAHPNGRVIAPRFLSSAIKRNAPAGDRLASLANWLTAPANRRFAEVQVNRVWFHLLGRGLVDPIDDFRSTNPPSHPELLEQLTTEFIAQGYDTQWLIRTIMASRTYQLASEPNATSINDDRNFSHVRPRRMTAEQLADAICQVLEVTLDFDGYPPGIRATQLPGVRGLRSKQIRPDDGMQFLAVFGKPPRLQACECERNNDTTLAQTFQLMSGPLLDDLLTRDRNRIGQQLTANRSSHDIVSDLYWRAVSRHPSAAEQAAINRLLAEGNDPRRVYEDLAWSLLTSNEFLLRR